MSNYVNLLDIVYPVGAVYISNNSTTPANIIGGTWTKVASDTFICSGTPNATGGTNAQKLSVSNLPSNVWLTGGTCKNFGLPTAISTLFSSATTFGIEASRITDDKTQQYSYEPFDNRPQYRAFNIYYRTA